MDHPPHGHDDLSNAVCGALVAASQRRKLELLVSDENEVEDNDETVIRELIKQEGGVWFPA